MISIICFSKDRPLQLKAYLESLFYCSGLLQQYVHIIYKESEGISYEKLIEQYPLINWRLETDFFRDVTEAVAISEKYILFGCDDVLFKTPFNLNTCIKALASNPQLLSFSLRLGANITDIPKLIAGPGYLYWQWTTAKSNHWKYPWEVSAAIYRKELVEQYLQTIGSSKSPNFLEDLFYQEKCSGFYQYIGEQYPCIACFETSTCFTITINRVQEDYLNEFDNTKATDIHTLQSYLLQGKRIEWEANLTRKNSNIHVGAEYFSLTGQELPVRKFITGEVLADAAALKDNFKLSNRLKLKIFFARVLIPVKEGLRPYIPRRIIKRLKKFI
jgi:hypothetical protein